MTTILALLIPPAVALALLLRRLARRQYITLPHLDIMPVDVPDGDGETM